MTNGYASPATRRDYGDDLRFGIEFGTSVSCVDPRLVNRANVRRPRVPAESVRTDQARDRGSARRRDDTIYIGPLLHRDRVVDVGATGAAGGDDRGQHAREGRDDHGEAELPAGCWPSSASVTGRTASSSPTKSGLVEARAG